MKKQPSLDELIKITKEVLQTKYPSAEFAFLAQSCAAKARRIFLFLNKKQTPFALRVGKSFLAVFFENNTRTRD